MRNTKARAVTVREYLSRVPPELRVELEQLRRTIRSAAPGAREVISYGMPALRAHGVLVYYAAFKDHLSFFPGSAETRRRFAKELRPWSGGKGTVRFTPENPLPRGLVARIVRARVAEDRKRATNRPRKRTRIR